MITASGARSEFNQIVQSVGEKVRFKYYTVTGSLADYDDDVTLTQSGTSFWTSGLCQPIGGKTSSYEATLMEQGKILQNDIKCFVDGTVNTSGTFKIGIGSPNFREYSMTDAGVKASNIGGEIVYKTIYLRFLTNGSLVGE